MKVLQYQYAGGQWKAGFASPGFDAGQAQLLLAFGEPQLLSRPAVFEDIRKLAPDAQLVLCSTAGEIAGSEVFDNSVVVTIVQFEKTSIRSCITDIRSHASSYEAGKYLTGALWSADLSNLFIVSDGMFINGSDLVAGLNNHRYLTAPVTGGLAGDGPRFKRTLVGLNSLPEEGKVVAIGFYGRHLKVGHGSVGGWDEFGPERVITRSEKNLLFEIDGKNALDLYKEYLGSYKDELPGSALLFPLSLTEPGAAERLVRTILGIDEAERSMRFAGNMPQGSRVRLMKANFDRLIDGSLVAARHSFTSLFTGNPELAILISCVGRKLILQDRTDEEVEAARKILGGHTPVTGFYSYGELSPLHRGGRCELHNQTMTITTFSEQ